MALFGSKKDPQQKRYEKLARKYKNYLIEESVNPLLNLEFMAKLLAGSEIEQELAQKGLADRIWERNLMADADELAEAWLAWQGNSVVDENQIWAQAGTLALHPGVYRNSEYAGVVEAATPIVQEAFVQACIQRLD